MSKKVINSGDFSLHIIASVGGVIIVRVFDRASKVEIESSIFTDADDNLRDYVARFTSASKSIFNFLNTI